MIGLVDLLAIVVVLAFLVLGVLRGLLREVLVLLGGIVLGALLGGIWADAWFSTAAADMQGVYRLISLYAIVIVVGYGSSLFLPKERPTWRQRLEGGAVGLLNGVLLLAFSLRYIQHYLLGDRADSVLQTALIPSALIRWFPWVLLGFAAAIVLVIAVAALIRLFHFFGHLTQPPEATPIPAVPPPVTPAPLPPSTPVPAPTPVPTPAPAEPAPPVDVPTISCPNCGNTIPADSAYCPNCGKILK